MMKTIDSAHREVMEERAEHLMRVGRKTNGQIVVQPKKPTYPQPRKSKKIK
ncbi:TPA: hypothetical protein RQK43_004339 [Vibrio vulnificus]|nr:hypothetical protein [Vibrio vulnificus]HDY7558027.1 hypothetical protein [Vibrio vulnificus]HDY7864548.1 hypothetical protein [Vibrio vulnificus]HDY7878404.1 hypothetical protein [Vibrio vulnificus]HDY8141388.1 hypothetical protein [Vibrio vulnificus]HDY8220333.1 hypothetical protein [Vibrio vulnificus]